MAELPYFSTARIQQPPELGGGTWQLDDLTQIACLFGKNGSGKSKLLRQWRNLDPSKSHYIVPERAGEIDYQANQLTDQMQAVGRQNQTQRNFQGEYRRQIIARIQAYFAARGNVRDKPLPTNPDELERLIEPLLPDFSLTLTTDAPPYKLTRISDGKLVSNIDQLSSGETQILTLALDVLTIAGIWDVQEVDTRLILIDEPDAHIHPDLQIRFADFLVQVSARFKLQVVVATHSTTFLAALGQFSKASASVIYMERETLQYTARKFDHVLQELSACLGGHALMGPLFGHPLLLVEGDDDYRIWSQVPRYHQINFSVIPSGGDEIKNYQRSLERIFSALRDEPVSASGFALIDRDKGKPVPSDSNPQRHIKFIQLECHESENLYLSDEVLAHMGTDWHAAQNAIRAKAASFGSLEAPLLELIGADRFTVDVKRTIQALSEIIDKKKALWTIRVAQAIGKGVPAGQLRAFLGEEVVAALWESKGVAPPPTS